MKTNEKNQKQISLSSGIIIRYCVGIIVLLAVFFAFKTLLAYWWIVVVYLIYQFITFLISLAIYVIKLVIKIFLVLMILGFLAQFIL